MFELFQQKNHCFVLFRNIVFLVVFIGSVEDDHYEVKMCIYVTVLEV